MSDDDTTIRRAFKEAMKGKVSREGYDRRQSDHLNVKDWLGYILAVLLPVAGALVTMWKTVHVQEVQNALQDEKIEDLEESQRQQWQRIGDLMGHDHD